jgi:hypothetical protein
VDRSFALTIWRDIAMLKSCTVLTLLVATVGSTVPVLGQEQDCSKVNERDQAECYYEQADSLATEIVETVAEKCRALEKKPQAQAFCTAYGMAALLEEAKKWIRKP